MQLLSPINLVDREIYLRFPDKSKHDLVPPVKNVHLLNSNLRAHFFEIGCDLSNF